MFEIINLKKRMKYLSRLIYLSLLISSQATAQPYATWTDDSLNLNNGIVERTIVLPTGEGPFITKSYKPVEGAFKYFTNTNTDFQFEANGKLYSGESQWILKNITRLTDIKQGDGAVVTLISKDKRIEVSVQFLLYPHSPAIRKALIIKNISSETINLESVDIEKFDITGYFASTFSWICHDYGHRRSLGPYNGNMQDALVIVHNSDWQQGIVIGNEAPGVLKHTSVFWDELTIASGLTHKDSRFPFRKYIQPGKSFTTPQVFTMVYNNHKDPDEVLNTAVPDFVRKYMGIRLSELKDKPTFVYNTWQPFEKNINEDLVKQLAKAAAAAGMKEFVIDDGWQDSYGDWNIDKTKFPHGLKPVFDYIKSLGMKPGLWVSVGSASVASKIFKEHPEWFAKDKDGGFANLLTGDPYNEVRSACFSTGWKEYIKKILLHFAVDYGLEYLKLDFSVVTSPYRYNHEASGCYATDHPGHKDHNESFYSNYQAVWKLFDELHATKSNLFIDCTFETMGGLQLIDYAMLKHAEGNWLSNYNGPDAKIDLRIRNIAWWRSPALPSTALVIGNPEMQDSAWDMHIKSLAGALPIMLGDPRQLSSNDLAKYRHYADWLQKMQHGYDIMSYRQDIKGLGEPQEGMWDGFQRINTETQSGGIIGVFKHGAVEKERVITIQYLDPLKIYDVKSMDGQVVATGTGFDLNTQGFTVELNSKYDGKLFEVKAR